MCETGEAIGPAKEDSFFLSRLAITYSRKKKRNESCTMIDLVNKAIQNLFHAWLVAESIFLSVSLYIHIYLSFSLSLSFSRSGLSNHDYPLSYFPASRYCSLDLPIRSFGQVWKRSRTTHAPFSDLTAFRPGRRYANREKVYIAIDLYIDRERRISSDD